MNTVVIKIPSHAVPSQSKHLVAAVELRKWCHEHVKNGWRSFFMAATEHTQQAQMDMARASYIGFTFDDPKEAMKFKLWAGNERG
jgi:hypothetical protein